MEPGSRAKALERLWFSIHHISSMVAPFVLLFNHMATPIKYIFLFLLGVGAGSVSLLWNLHVFRPIFDLWFLSIPVRFRIFFMTKERRDKEGEKYMHTFCPIGQDPLDVHFSYHTYAAPGDCDFFGHMTNSSYPKVCDAARMRLVMKMFPMLFFAHGTIALGAMHFDFIREIPMLAPYEVRVTFGGWDQKWLYVISKFVTCPKTAKKGSKVNTSLDAGAEASVSSKRQSKLLIEPDGAMVHCISVAQLCFKMEQRITVPPALALAINGFSVPPPSNAAPYSDVNHPPTWSEVRKLALPQCGGSPSRLRAFLKGGWREETKMWWEAAVGGSLGERKEVLEAMIKLRSGVEKLRGERC